jgi:hypothetical protein
MLTDGELKQLQIMKYSYLLEVPKSYLMSSKYQAYIQRNKFLFIEFQP